MAAFSGREGETSRTKAIARPHSSHFVALLTWTERSEGGREICS
jgi:hypothetical protein